MTSAADPWYSDGLSFRCVGCGVCCRGPTPGWVGVDDDDADRLADHLGVSLRTLGRRYLRRTANPEAATVSLVEKSNLDCVFWEEGRGCQV